MFGLMALGAHAEATFEQVQTLIEQRNYDAAEKGLEVIIQNHPKSAKAFYAMAQAQAGLGNQEKAKKALDIATGLNPTLDFAPASSVASLKQAITPQVAKIEAIEETHTVRNTILVIFVLALGVAVYMVYRRNKEAEEEYEAKRKQEDADRAERHASFKRAAEESRKAEEAEREALRAHKNYGHERFDPTNPDVLLPKKTKAQEKAEAAEKQRLFLEAEARRERLRAEAAEDDARRARMTYSTPAPTVVHTNSGSNDLLTGVLIGNMLSGSHHDHDTTIIRETTREVPSYTPSPTQSVRESKSSSWDDTPSTPSRSSSWDDDSSSSKSSSSSWSSSSDSSSSSSWDSGSSSSDSGSSSSWD